MILSTIKILALATFIIVSFGRNAIAEQVTPIFSLPLECELNSTCFIQNYMDIDPSENAKDYACNSSTYDTHKGVDFRLLSTQASKQGVSVLSAASGTIIATRDGMADRLVSSSSDLEIKNRECGNGVVIDHGNGWETQYCHMRQNSVIVKKGEIVTKGQMLGLVGYSGLAQFAHVHISVRHNGEIIDPFSGNNNTSNTCSSSADISNGMWDSHFQKIYNYQNGQLIQSGFSTTPVKPISLETGEIPTPPNSTSAQAIVFFARFINLKKGDEISFEIISPKGVVVLNIAKPLERNKAHYVAYSGKKRPKENWVQGEYIGIVKLLREGKIIIKQEKEIQLF
jgi:murein DD-endopeptidase MepM/ murein hydrolase activator NlpD